MKIGVLSGKGGAGKTLLSVNLSALGGNSTYIDCDVEEPNGHLFLKPTDVIKKDVAIKIPDINHDLCNGCRACTEFCNFNALAFVKEKVIVFEEVCHSCGGCTIICPQKAITEKDKVIGCYEEGKSENTKVITGILNIGEVSGVPIIDELNEKARLSQGNVFIDCPPGSACSVMESIKEVDYCVIVAEPTIYGVHNVQMVCELVQKFNKPFGIVINKSFDENNPAKDFCVNNNITILGEIPFDKELGTINSEARIAVKESEKYRRLFLEILTRVEKEAQGETVINS